MGTRLVAVLGVVLAGIVLLAAPATPGVAFFVAAASLVAATLAALVGVRRTLANERSSAGVWLQGATVPVGLLWMGGAFVQALTSPWWSWKAATAVDLVAAGIWAMTSMVAGAAANAARRDEVEREAGRERHARLLAAARDALGAGERTGVRVELAERVLRSRPGELGDALAEENIESQLRTAHGER